ncbi:hypothetical protein Q0F99_16020 [Rathayibacter oskolensis]|uniref:hypothetical protein n=1 Tax=Rathayibacter oskolensis TaxID=1891671 RepID=UPI00265F0E65|nr:hypothetical protein [Rathayibacter oskolensis]WKK71090.1 hypothetical protein Q0F99_16020 [Rathayibacter oskolensis]
MHQEDQLAWMATGSMELGVLGDQWHLRREHLAWIPAGVPHEMTFVEQGDLISVYADPTLRPPGDRWGAHAPSVSRTSRGRCCSTSPMRTLRGAAPAVLAAARRAARRGARPRRRGRAARDPRARTVAAALLDDPADPVSSPTGPPRSG